MKSFFRNVNPVHANTSSEASKRNHPYMNCAARCVGALANCTSYLHNTSTGLCLLAPSPDRLVPRLASGHGDLYVSCDAEKGYLMHRYGSATSCLNLVRDARENYTEAVSRCEQLAGSLVSVKSQDKLYLLTSVMGSNSSFWVGLDDMEEEGTYVWREDGQVAFTANNTSEAAAIAELTMNGLWDHPREPNDFGGNEDCVQLKYSISFNALRLNDFRCNTNNRFVCEMPVRFA